MIRHCDHGPKSGPGDLASLASPERASASSDRCWSGAPSATPIPDKGHIRSFLRADIASLLADARDREAAGKRGGVRFVPLGAEGRYAAEPAELLTSTAPGP